MVVDCTQDVVRIGGNVVSHHQYLFMVGGFIHFLEGLTYYRPLSLCDGHLVFQSSIAHSLRNSLSLTSISINPGLAPNLLQSINT